MRTGYVRHGDVTPTPAHAEEAPAEIIAHRIEDATPSEVACEPHSTVDHLACPYGRDRSRAGPRFQIRPLTLGECVGRRSRRSDSGHRTRAFSSAWRHGELRLVRLCAAQQYDLLAVSRTADATESDRDRLAHCRVSIPRVRCRLGARATPSCRPATVLGSGQSRHLRSLPASPISPTTRLGSVDSSLARRGL
jgi:hypothetical protein